MRIIIFRYTTWALASTFLLATSPNAMGQQSRVASATPVIESGDARTDAPYLVVLGIAQDAGYPQAGCRKACCARAWAEPNNRRHVVCLAIVDPASHQRWLIECTPDFREQLHQLNAIAAPQGNIGIDGIFLTHAHIGHYSGLIHVGREAIGADRIPVYAMPRMRRFLEGNGPWSQLVTSENIVLHELADGTQRRLNERISVTPFLVPHRDEFSETVGYRIQGPHRSAIFLPDIDKWNRWKIRIEDVLSKTDVAYLDGTFFADGELTGRDMSQIPHPFMAQSIQRFADLPKSERDKVRFLHFNHTNPVLDSSSPEAGSVRDAGHHLAVEGEVYEL